MMIGVKRGVKRGLKRLGLWEATRSALGREPEKKRERQKPTKEAAGTKDTNQKVAPAARSLQLTKATPVADREAKQKAAAEARISRFQQGEDWSHGAVSRRSYENYDAYLTHQTAKLDGLKKSLEAKSEGMVASFVARFEGLGWDRPLSVLCLGARLGQEVQAFIKLGHFAVGIDLNPGEGNKYVVVGDFHHLVFADASIDKVYINSVDHILEVDRILQEIKRVLKADGQLVADIVYGYEEGFWAGEYEVLHWPTAKGFAEHLAEIGGLNLISTRDLTSVGSPKWVQCVFDKMPPS